MQHLWSVVVRYLTKVCCCWYFKFNYFNWSVFSLPNNEGVFTAESDICCNRFKWYHVPFICQLVATLAIKYEKILVTKCMMKIIAGPLFTKLTGIVPPNLVNSRSRVNECCNDHIALKFDKHLESAAAEEKFKPESRGFETSRDLAVGRPSDWWIDALGTRIDWLSWDNIGRSNLFISQIPDSGSIMLIHWGRDKMAAISQTTFSSAFPKIYEFRWKFNWNLFLSVQLTIL